ncbi:MAG: methylated-DNA--[protein]-cysteine S-methyltransferase [Coriobacteriia bacterium]
MDPANTTATAEDAARRAAALVEDDPTAAHTLASLAAAVGLSPSHLRRVFARKFGLSPAAYARAVRLGRMREGLREGRGVARAGFEAGFGSGRAIYEHATRGLAMAPSAYGRGGRGLEVRYSTGASRLGRVLVGATERGVCCVLFADDDTAAEAALRAEFPAAVLARDDAGIAEQVRRVVGLIDGTGASADIPLDLVGTPFQRAVWAELRRIPPGETATYAEVARRIGEPRAVRAVAGACAGNHAAVVVPCHRVVRSDGGLGGYKWGVERKRDLLENER